MTSKKRSLAVPILEIHNPAPDTWRMKLYEPEIATNALAGNFVNVAVDNAPNLLWRRPLGIHQTDPKNGTFEILFKAVGRGTGALAQLTTDDQLDIIGPLGNTFTHPPGLEEAIMVAGGLGIALFPLLLQNLAEKNIKRTLFFGVKTAGEFCCLNALMQHDTELVLSTEDGSRGHTGYITDSLEEYLNSLTSMENKQLYVCGPTPMMQAVQKMALHHNIQGQVSLENIMACGFGACMGCPVPLAVPKPDGTTYLLACKDGPVFNMKDIIIND